MKTLPELAVLWGAHPDCLRTFLRRRRPDLLALAHRLGPTFGFDVKAAKVIRKAFERRARRPQE